MTAHASHWQEFALVHEPLETDLVVHGEPSTATTELDAFADAAVGLWSHSTGSSHDIEVDELFVVLEGLATVTDLDRGTVIALAPGTLCSLRAGMRTRWDVQEPLTKLYIAGVRQEKP